MLKKCLPPVGISILFGHFNDIMHCPYGHGKYSWTVWCLTRKLDWNNSVSLPVPLFISFISIIFIRTSVALRHHLVLVGILAKYPHLYNCYSQTGYLLLCNSWTEYMRQSCHTDYWIHTSYVTHRCKEEYIES